MIALVFACIKHRSGPLPQLVEKSSPKQLHVASVPEVAQRIDEEAAADVFSLLVKSFSYCFERGRVASSLRVLFTYGCLVRETLA